MIHCFFQFGGDQQFHTPMCSFVGPMPSPSSSSRSTPTRLPQQNKKRVLMVTWLQIDSLYQVLAHYVERSSGAVNHSTMVLLFKREHRTTMIRHLGPVALILCTSDTSSKTSTKLTKSECRRRLGFRSIPSGLEDSGYPLSIAVLIVPSRGSLC